jgi:hypothetical protein
MPIPRLKANVLQTIHHRPWIPIQTRCLRTKPHHLLPPRQAVFGLAIPSVAEIDKRVRRKLRRKADTNKIPVVPKVTEDEKPIKQPKKPVAKPKKAIEDMTEDELEEHKKLEEQEKRIAEFEEGEKVLRGKSDIDREIAAARERGKEEQGVQSEQMEEKTHNIVYPRDVIGRRFKKEKVKYKIDVY